MLQQCHGPIPRDATVRLDQGHHPVGVRLRLNHRRLKPWVGSIAPQRFHRQKNRPNENDPKETQVEAVTQPPPPDERHASENSHDHSGNDDRPDQLALVPKPLGQEIQFQELEEEEKIPLRTRRVERLRRIGGRMQLSPVMSNGQVHHRRQNRQAGNAIHEHLVRPEIGLGLTIRLFGGDAMLAEQGHVRRDGCNHQPGQYPGMQGEEPSERVMAVVGTADNEFLEGGPDQRHDPNQTCGHLRRAKALLIPREQIPGQAQSQREHEEHHTKPVVDLTRRLVGSVDDHLQQM